ncbi:MAG: hypothetical protein AAGD13_11370 [Pseudomonadota bacterium]
MRLIVLVPTWMPSPPELPTFDVPNIMVRQGGRAATAISERIDGKTWSGISRKYLLYPLVAGTVSLPEQNVSIIYAAPGTREPTVFETETEAISISGIVPEGAGDLDPLITAQDLKIIQELQGDPASLEPGDAIVRTSRIEIVGTTPMVIPETQFVEARPGLSIYPSEPFIDQRQADDGTLSGARTEKTTFVAEAGGRFAVPEREIRWFNLKTGTVETAIIEGFEMTVRGPPPVVEEEVDWRTRVVSGLVILGALGLLGTGLWWTAPRVGRWLEQRRQAYRASEKFAFNTAIAHLRRRNLGKALPAVRHWWNSISPGARDLPKSVVDALAKVGAEKFGRSTTQTVPKSWRDAETVLREARRTALRAKQSQKSPTLPGLNPVADLNWR